MRHASDRSQAVSSHGRADDRFAARLQRIVVVRLIAILSFLLSFFVLRVFMPGFQAAQTPSIDQVVYTLLLVAIGLNIVFLVQLRRAWLALRTQALVQFTSDLLLTTALVYFFGGASSPFSSIFFVVIILTATFLGRRAEFIVASGAWVLYAAAALSRQYGWAPGSVATQDPLSEVAYRLILHLLGFVLVALLAARLTGQLSRAESDLARLQVEHRDIVESIPSGLITFDPNGIVLTANAAATKILGHSAESLVDRQLSETGLFVDQPWQDFAWSDENPPRFETSYESGGETRPIGFSLTEMTSAGGEPTGFVLIFQDLHEWRKLQEELQLKDRMAAVGEMAAGIAHEIGNPLAALSGSAQMLQPSLAEGSSQRTLLDIILRESQRLDRTIKSFLQFARPTERSSVLLDIAELLRSNTELLRNSEEVLPGHQIHLDLEEASAEIIADADQISQIFWNLTRNALRAMDSAGDLYIRGRLRDDVYSIAFRDTGRGMTAGDRSQLFYPFRTSFTGGTGIGMAIVYRIVEEHGGRLKVESEAGKGTLITVDLPVTRTAPAPAP
ncbi:MAG: ATP-binding protein [Acidobacteria bacterium]|nr:ATP-binding protein [Acidobacteriota bacterium]